MFCVAWAAPLTVRATRPVGCAEGRGLGIICGSLLSSPHLNQALQKPLDNVFFPSLPTPRLPPNTDSEDMVLWKEHGAGSQETGSYSPKSAHFLVGRDSLRSLCWLWSKAASLDSDHLEVPGSLVIRACNPLGSWQVAAQLRKPPRRGPGLPMAPPPLAPSLPTMPFCQAYLKRPARISWPMTPSFLEDCPFWGQAKPSAAVSPRA